MVTLVKDFREHSKCSSRTATLSFSSSSFQVLNKYVYHHISLTTDPANEAITDDESPACYI